MVGSCVVVVVGAAVVVVVVGATVLVVVGACVVVVVAIPIIKKWLRIINKETNCVIPNKIKMLIEKSRKCHNHKSKTTPDTNRKREMTKTNTYKRNKQMHE